MATKLEELDKKHHDLSVKSGKISTDLEALAVEEQDLTTDLGAAVLAGNGTAKLETELSKLGARRLGLEAAKHQAETALDALRADRIRAEREAFHQLTLETAERIRLEMVAAYAQIKDLAAAEKAWEAALKNLVDTGGVKGYEHEASMAAALRNVWEFGGLQAYDSMEKRRGFTNNTPAQVLEDPTLTWELRT